MTSDPNNDPRIVFEGVERCLCAGVLRAGPVWGWGVCPACGTWVNTRRPTQESLRYVYDDTYWTVTQEMVACPPLEARFESDMLDRIPAYLGVLLPHLRIGVRVAETGCGNARVLHELKRRGFEVVGTEFSPNVIERVRKLTDVTILQGGVERLEPESCDALVSIDVMEHVHDPRSFLSAHAKVLRPGGVMLVHTPVHERPIDPYAYSVGMLWKLYHLYLFGRGLAERLFTDAGFVVENREVKVFGWPVYLLRKR